MQIKMKKSIAYLALPLLALAVAAAAFFAGAFTASAAQLGSEQPQIYCTYVDQNGNEADGNSLSAGTYDVSFNLSGVESFSVLQITASYDPSVTVAPQASQLLSDDPAVGASSMGEVIGGGSIVLGFVADGSDCSQINSGGTRIATVTMTFAEPCDASDLINADVNPNLTFLQASYADGFDDSYALDTEFDGYDGALYQMSCDITPAVAPDAFDISGQIKIAIDVTGADTSVGIVGINVAVTDESGAVIADAVTDENGYYTLAGVPAGEYKMLVSGPTTVDRTVTLQVTGNKVVGELGIVVCDYNKDGAIDTTDKLIFSDAFIGNVSEYSIYCNFNDDTNVDATDKLIFSSFFNKSVVYSDVTF